MKAPTVRTAMRLLHDMAAELEMGFGSYGKLDYCIEIPAKDASRLLARYERLRKKIKSDHQLSPHQQPHNP